MASRQSLHALVDALAEEELDQAKEALQGIREFDLSQEDLKELQRRASECDEGRVIDAQQFLQQLRAETADSPAKS